jgi:hypothetical protein
VPQRSDRRRRSRGSGSGRLRVGDSRRVPQPEIAAGRVLAVRGGRLWTWLPPSLSHTARASLSGPAGGRAGWTIRLRVFRPSGRGSVSGSSGCGWLRIAVITTATFQSGEVRVACDPTPGPASGSGVRPREVASRARHGNLDRDGVRIPAPAERPSPGSGATPASYARTRAGAHRAVQMPESASAGEGSDRLDQLPILDVMKAMSTQCGEWRDGPYGEWRLP